MSSRPRRLLRLQGLPGIGQRGPARGEERGGQGHRQQHRRRGGEGHRVARTPPLEEQRRDEPAGPERGEGAGRDARRGQTDAARHHQAQEVPRLGAEGAPDAELQLALAHPEGDDRVEADGREQQRQQGRGAEQPGAHPP